jgi:hypothetical protein
MQLIVLIIALSIVLVPCLFCAMSTSFLCVYENDVMEEVENV